MGRKEKRGRGPADAADENNLWIKVNRAWFTPHEFEKRFRDGFGIKEEKIEILNPLVALAQGRKVIEGMIQQKKPVSTILNAYERLNKFADKIIQEQYRPKPTQVNSAEWPETSNEERRKEREWINAQWEEKRLARIEAAMDKKTYEPDNDFLNFKSNNPDF